MAKNKNFVLLGYQDDLISDKYTDQVDFKVNKIGGEADFPIDTIDKYAICKLCTLPCRLIVQIYAPLDTCTDHRTLYLFACINPSCWNRQESWICLRLQMRNENSSPPKAEIKSAIKLNTTDWCSKANDWDDDDESNASLDRENSNVVNDNSKQSEDEESSSFDDMGLENLSIDEENANNDVQGAVARLYSPMATAELEADVENSEMVTVESPTAPKTNLEALLQSCKPTMENVSIRASFIPYFMSVYPEEENITAASSMDDHVKDLLNDYQKKGGDSLLNLAGKVKDVRVGSHCPVDEEYEKSRPLHGDKNYHQFITKIKDNPQQILRYHREGLPLLLYPLEESVGVCKYCKQELVFEFQLVPTLISKLRLPGDQTHCNRLDFGTVLVYTCKASCWGSNDSLRQEVVVVQKEIY